MPDGVVMAGYIAAAVLTVHILPRSEQMRSCLDLDLPTNLLDIFSFALPALSAGQSGSQSVSQSVCAVTASVVPSRRSMQD